MEEVIRKVLAQLERGLITPAEFDQKMVEVVLNWLKAYGQDG